MRLTADNSETNDYWAPYSPTDAAPWNLERVVHLHRRAGLGASWTELERDLREGPESSVNRLLKGEVKPHETAEGFEKTSQLLADAAVASRDPNRLKAWWVFRMLFGPDPLGERLTLVWHNHFATSNVKVDDPGLMRTQNETLRKWARAPFGELVGAMLKDPALLAWLDAPANRKGHPNENLARELMELFTLGIGHYTETDVQESARALTGLNVKDNAFKYTKELHDDGEKTILGKKGAWSADDLAKVLLESPATSQRLAMRLCELLMGENKVEPAGLEALAEGLRKHDLNISWGVETILRSSKFFEQKNMLSRVADPVIFVIAPIRSFALLEPPPSTLVLADWIARIGQDLFHPPNVGGWKGGRNWLGSRGVIARTNYAAGLIQGRGIGRAKPLDALALAEPLGLPKDRGGALLAASRLLLGQDPSPQWLEKLTAKSADEPDAARQNVGLLLACPKAQLN